MAKAGKSVAKKKSIAVSDDESGREAGEDVVHLEEFPEFESMAADAVNTAVRPLTGTAKDQRRTVE